MNVVIGMIYIFKEENLREDQKEYFDIIMFFVENFLVIINDILDYSKMEVGRMVIECINFDVKEVINNIYKMFFLKVKDKQLLFQLDMEEDIFCYFVGDFM